ncbi:PfkB family carbohydrate kinase [Brevibacterium luteolum]|uniref:pyridoxal kinase n=1 Tax=Brevibacterium luteolum TaxID=199591 RepID=A0A849AQR7_9MICO|nr:hydroxymethylpyrimidine/phosphomethylpyrimidine kinase [Brevibacterium luteolum]MBM7528646.1 pyridoxine kinase [Brevibacterium luteolum]NNG79149.1 hydroxymethylpyrimidine/phosphomethylpyrimidine kinase [Brevibacterium luteolum]
MTAPRGLTVAGLDVSGGAGLGADMKMFEEYGVFSAAVITCVVTFDPDNGFYHSAEFQDADFIRQQLDSTLTIHDYDVIKSGMVGSVDSALVLADRLKNNHLPYVFDPVLVCKGTGSMVDLKDLFIENLVPLATVITPNLEEAATLVGAAELTNVDEMAEAAKAIHAMGADNVVVKGGARLDTDEAIDVLYDGQTLTTFSSKKITNDLVNGAGCSFAAAIAAGLATGLSVPEAVRKSKETVAHGIGAAVPNATGVGSLLHPAARCYRHEGIVVEQH